MGFDDAFPHTWLLLLRQVLAVGAREHALGAIPLRVLSQQTLLVLQLWHCALRGRDLVQCSEMKLEPEPEAEPVSAAAPPIPHAPPAAASTRGRCEDGGGTVHQYVHTARPSMP